MEKITRKAIVSGRFYPSDPAEINKMIDRMVENEKYKIKFSLSKQLILGAILPHAGHMYSGYQTVHFFEILKQSEQTIDLWIIIHPFHYCGNLDFAAERSDFWNTPLGNVRVDKDFIETSGLPVSCEMHKNEHSSEVIIPFIQKYFKNDFSIVSIGISKQDVKTCHEISQLLIEQIKLSKKKICIIASSDFSHYIHPEAGRILDQKVVNKILDKKVIDIYNEVIDNSLTVCGYGPIMVLINILNTLHPEAIPEILSRGHSGEVIPSKSVVDYISFLFHENYN